MNRPIWKMYWHNGCKMTVRRMMEEQKSKSMDQEKIRKINSNIGKMTDAMDEAGMLKEAPELKDWQWEIILENESKDEG